MTQPDERNTDDGQARLLVAAAVTCEGALAIAALILGLFLERPPMSQFEWTVPAIGRGILYAGPPACMLVLITWFPFGPLQQLDALVRERLVPLFRPCTLAQLLVICLVAGFGEEMLFRGAIQQGIEQWTLSQPAALAVASALFGLAHPITPAYAVLAAVMGAYLGWLWLATGNLLVPTVAHAAYDFVALVYLIHRERPALDVGPAADAEA